jgi:hypothetical protein
MFVRKPSPKSTYSARIVGVLTVRQRRRVVGDFTDNLCVLLVENRPEIFRLPHLGGRPIGSDICGLALVRGDDDVRVGTPGAQATSRRSGGKASRAARIATRPDRQTAESLSRRPAGAGRRDPDRIRSSCAGRHRCRSYRDSPSRLRLGVLTSVCYQRTADPRSPLCC